MKKHLPDILRRHDAYVTRMMKKQVKNPHSAHYGGYMITGYHVDPRFAGFTLARLITSYVCRESLLYRDEELRCAIEANMRYLQAHQRESGCVDLTSVNPDSAPDTAFMCNHLLNGYWLMEKRGWPELEPLRDQLLSFIVRCCEGVAQGGFHTPNHRWANAACLMSVWKITGREDFRQRAEEYLSEGIDINDDGEFAERSAGNYNQVNDDQLIRLYLATGERQYLEYARRNLMMMNCYIEPDHSIFTGNSTRQDKGTKVYLEAYYPIYLLTAYLLGDKELGAMAEWVYCVAGENVTSEADSEIAAWLLLFEDLDGFGTDEPSPLQEHYERYFRESGIVRVRRGDTSFTILENRPDFLYFQHGSASMYMAIHSRVTYSANFKPESIEPIEGGYRLRARMACVYSLPLYPEKPETSDWWKMDHSRRKKREGEPLVYTIDVLKTEDGGIDVHIHSEGLDQVPTRVEIGFEPGTQMRTPTMMLEGKAGDTVTLLAGDAEMTGPHGELITLTGAFGQHNFTARRAGAYPVSPAHFTVYMTAYSPVDQVIHIGTKPIYREYLF